jgi:hypothetical protein
MKNDPSLWDMLVHRWDYKKKMQSSFHQTAVLNDDDDDDDHDDQYGKTFSVM